MKKSENISVIKTEDLIGGLIAPIKSSDRCELLLFIVFTILKPHPNVPRLCGTGVHRCPSASINAADIGLAYLTGVVMFLTAFRSDS
jgi:hypothetical protein